MRLLDLLNMLSLSMSNPWFLATDRNPLGLLDLFSSLLRCKFLGLQLHADAVYAVTLVDGVGETLQHTAETLRRWEHLQHKCASMHPETIG